MPLPTPIGRQREVLYLPADGHTVVLGTAGSGKTNLAILRAAYLARPGMDHTGRTLLLTFNKALVAYLRHIGGSELAGVTVENYHRFARGYLASRNKIGQNDICSRASRRIELITDAVTSLSEKIGDHPILQESAEFFSEEIQHISQLGVRSFKEYCACAPQLPQHIEGDAETLHLLWQLRGEYDRIRHAAGFRYDWDSLAMMVCDELDSDGSERRYRHIVIDEGQDFSPVMIKSLTKAVPDNGTVTFFGDVAQQIYGHRFSWRAAGLKISKPWLFEENYRNTKQIAEFALAITKMPYYKGSADLVSPKSPAASGPKPALVSFRTSDAELDFVGKLAVDQSKVGSVAILTRNHEEKKRFSSWFQRGTFTDLNNEIVRWKSGAGLSIGTYHSSKGVEFDTVILPGLDGEAFPDTESVNARGREYAEQAAGRLLYVGVTRAKSTLIMTHASAVTPLLPVTANLVQAIQK